MKTVLRLGVVAVLFGLLALMGSADLGGLKGPSKALAAPNNNLTINVVDTTPGTPAQQFDVDPPGACTGATFSLRNGESDTVTCNDASSSWAVTVTPAAQSLLTNGNSCTFVDDEGVTAGIQSSVVSFSNNILRVLIVDNEDATCTFTFAPAVTQRTLEVVADPPVIQCGGTSTLTATVRDQDGNLVNGLTFSFVTDAGTIDNDGSATATLTLPSDGTDANVTVSVPGATDIAPVTLTVANQCAPLSIFADPPYLPCGGGTTKLTAVLRNKAGDVIPDAVFQWSTTDGSLDVGVPNSPAAIDGNAVLFLPSAIQSATVTAAAAGDSVSVTVRQVRAPLAIAVTADPNVIPCGGTANLTASTRDVNGRLIEGLGYHWSVVTTDNDDPRGLLYVGPPNTADETDPHATLTMVPGMKSTTVEVWVGDLTDHPGTVTVQQFCPDVVTDGSGATGSIQLSASSVTAGCGEAIFIGARVRDAKNQVPAEGRDVRFLASAGVFQVDAGVTTTYGADSPSQNLVTVSQYNAATDKNGVLNATYLAPLYGGDAVITAASGDKFAKLTIHVNCAAPPPAAVAGSGGTARACTPIGDGVCIPATGVSIKPPSTGDAGLK